MYVLKGEVKFIGETIQISDKFKKRDIVITDASGQYQQHILFQLTQDRCDSIGSVKIGEIVEVTFFLRGREWTNPKDGQVKYFNTLDAYKVVCVRAKGENYSEDTQVVTQESEDDDLPF